MTFGEYLKRQRHAAGMSVRELAAAVGKSPTWVSRLETGHEKPSEKGAVALAKALGEDPDVALAVAGMVSERLRAVIIRRPRLFADLLEQLDSMPDHAVVRIAREVRDGKW